MNVNLFAIGSNNVLSNNVRVCYIRQSNWDAKPVENLSNLY